MADDTPAAKRIRLLDPTLPELLARAGYANGIIGTWHLHPDPFLLGFDYALYPVTIPYKYFDRVCRETRRSDSDISSRGARESTVAEFLPGYFSRKVDDFIRANRDRPFFLHYAIPLPHMPIGPGNLPERYVRMYDPSEVPLRKNVFDAGKMAHDDWWFKVYLTWDYFQRNARGRVPDRPGDRLPEGFDLKDLTAYYYGAVTCVDDLIGELVSSLERNGIADDTIIVLAADHGDNLGSHGLFNKGQLYEESVRIPLIFRYPNGWKPGSDKLHAASTIDIAPTLLEACGVTPHARMQGRSLLPLMNGKQRILDRTFAVIETPGRQIGIRTPSHLYGMQLAPDRRRIEDDSLFFFDLERDPYELRNFAKTEHQRAIASELRTQLTEWNRQTPWLQTEKV
jgi:choline-sulfatase